MALKDLIIYSVNTDSSKLHLSRYKSNIKKENNNENYYFFFRKLDIIFLLKKLFCSKKTLPLQMILILNLTSKLK